MNFKNLSREINRLETKVKKIKEKKIEIEKKKEKLTDQQRELLEILDILYELEKNWKGVKNEFPENFSTFLICVNGELKPAIPIEAISPTENLSVFQNIPHWLCVVPLKDLIKSKCPYCQKESYVIKRFYQLQKTSSEKDIHEKIIYRSEFLIICCNKIIILNYKDITC